MKDSINTRLRIVNPFVRQVEHDLEEIKSILDVEIMSNVKFDDAYNRDLENLHSYIRQDTQKKTQDYVGALNLANLLVGQSRVSEFLSKLDKG